MSDAPPWMRAELTRLLSAYQGEPGNAQMEGAVDQILSGWTGQSNNFRNLAALWQRLDELEPASSRIDLLKLVAACQGNFDALRPFLSEEVLDHLTDLEEGIGLDGKLLADARLSLLSVPPQKYRQYLKALRADAAMTTDSDFIRGRRRFIDAILSRPRPFLTPFASKWESQLRQNLEGELAGLDGGVAPEMKLSRVSSAQKLRDLQRGTARLGRERKAEDTSSLEEVIELFAHRRRR